MPLPCTRSGWHTAKLTSLPWARSAPTAKTRPLSPLNGRRQLITLTLTLHTHTHTLTLHPRTTPPPRHPRTPPPPRSRPRSASPLLATPTPTPSLPARARRRRHASPDATVARLAPALGLPRSRPRSASPVLATLTPTPSPPPRTRRSRRRRRRHGRPELGLTFARHPDADALAASRRSPGPGSAVAAATLSAATHVARPRSPLGVSTITTRQAPRRRCQPCRLLLSCLRPKLARPLRSPRRRCRPCSPRRRQP
ncbi:hypothetical protein PVAP13_9NG204446 [Panicum virgatum]|uniref:Uncharacterized protein n=1 Tax=Panicum virgatum TaxID=38727 RepID=A0A8T0MNU7_PANVG|nr:hypothetical protein PVAP13_9NG204446 [Panicum virgatum]